MEIFKDLYAFQWNNPMSNNCNTYFINRHKRILIDPGHFHFFSHIRDNLSALSLSPEDIDLVIVTHGHPDHFEGVKIFLEASSIIAMHKTELDFLNHSSPHLIRALGIERFEPHIFLAEGDLRAGDMNFQVIHTPGHSPGSVCLYWPDMKVLFSGDVVFDKGIGRTDLPGGNGEELKESIKKLSLLEVESLLPGHGQIVEGKKNVENNFEIIERMWFGYL
ncbi:MAG: MBL fold metallo-hydrolase [Deltaproteobacteria bacterium]|nr:MBL fold metallo-hydrolase [Deltaproteobacteria bacterium]